MEKKIKTHINIENFRILKLNKYYVALNSKEFNYKNEDDLNSKIKTLFNKLECFLQTEHPHDSYSELYYDCETKENFKKLKHDYNFFNFVKEKNNKSNQIFIQNFKNVDFNDLIFRCSLKTINKIVARNKIIEIERNLIRTGV